MKRLEAGGWRGRGRRGRGASGNTPAVVSFRVFGFEPLNSSALLPPACSERCKKPRVGPARADPQLDSFRAARAMANIRSPLVVDVDAAIDVATSEPHPDEPPRATGTRPLPTRVGTARQIQVLAGHDRSPRNGSRSPRSIRCAARSRARPIGRAAQNVADSVPHGYSENRARPAGADAAPVGSGSPCPDPPNCLRCVCSATSIAARAWRQFYRASTNSLPACPSGSRSIPGGPVLRLTTHRLGAPAWLLVRRSVDPAPPAVHDALAVVSRRTGLAVPFLTRQSDIS